MAIRIKDVSNMKLT